MSMYFFGDECSIQKIINIEGLKFLRFTSVTSSLKIIKQDNVFWEEF